MSIADTIRLKLDVGSLPRSKPERLYGAHGDRQPCTACDEPILPAQLQYEFDLPDHGTFRFHVGCLGLWEGELLKRAGGGDPTQSSEDPRRHYAMVSAGRSTLPLTILPSWPWTTNDSRRCQREGDLSLGGGDHG
jgi:hypothetical protein